MASFQLFVQLADHANLQEVSEKIKMVTFNHVDEFEKTYNPQLFLHPMKDWHLRNNWQNGINRGGLIQFVWLFGIIGLFVLILACINFMNLSTAQSEKRSREIGIRKSIGSLRNQLIHQFLVESYLVVILSFVLSVMLVLLAIPYFNDFSSQNPHYPSAKFPSPIPSLKIAP